MVAGGFHIVSGECPSGCLSALVGRAPPLIPCLMGGARCLVGENRPPGSNVPLGVNESSLAETGIIGGVNFRIGGNRGGAPST